MGGQPNNPLPKKLASGGIPTFGRCTKHNKVRFRSRADAKKAAKKDHRRNTTHDHGGRLNAYACDENPDQTWWHVGSVPPKIAASWTRAKLNNPTPREGST